MYYQVSKEFIEKLPTAYFGAVAVRGLANTRDIPELEQMLAENVASCEGYFAGKKPKETEDIVPYRMAFTSLGINPNKFLCSIEALLTRIAKGKGLPHIKLRWIWATPCPSSIGSLWAPMIWIPSTRVLMFVWQRRGTPLFPSAVQRRKSPIRVKPSTPPEMRSVPAAGHGVNRNAVRSQKIQRLFCSQLTAFLM